MSERLLIVTHRFGPDIPGGAERHLWELATRLPSQEGIECEVWTTDGLDLAPVAHWGVMMRPGFPVGEQRMGNGLVVRRFPLAHWPRKLVALACKGIQRRWEHEERSWDPARLLPYGAAQPGGREPGAESDLPELLPGPGWHHPEPQADGSTLRWTLPEFSLLRKAGGPRGFLTVSGLAPRTLSLSLRQSTRPLGALTIRKGWFSVRFEIPEAEKQGDILVFECGHAFRPWRDHRTLGVMVGEISFQGRNSETSVRIPHWEDYRALLRRRWDDLIARYLERASGRPEVVGALFDWVRGPRCGGLWRALADSDRMRGFSGVMAGNLPWGVIPKVAHLCPLPLAALALWHLDDEFYYWQHYVDALRRARVVLSNTRWAAEEVWPQMGVEARWGGPGVDERWAHAPSRCDRASWRSALGLSADTPVILSVARKSPAKRYDLVIAAVERLRQRHPEATLVLVGPDEDRRPIESPAVRYTGPMKDPELHDAYCHADVFAMMSESESFGMVFVEAWMRGVPVVANRWCRPVASLIDDGVDGFLASGPEDLEGVLARLLDNPEMQREVGKAGKEKTLRDHTWSACTARVARALRERLFSQA